MIPGLIHPCVLQIYLLAPALFQALYPAGQKRQGSCSNGAYILVGGDDKETSKEKQAQLVLDSENCDPPKKNPKTETKTKKQKP